MIRETASRNILKYHSRYGLILLIVVVSFFVETLKLFSEDKTEFYMDFDELKNVQIHSPGTLTPTTLRKSPSSSTLISSEMIKSSGARSLEQLLEIFVPNMQIMRHQPVGVNKGARGLLFDLDDKILLLVNGKVMNNNTFYGADSEFMLSMLGDIKHINVIRGPGSSTYGPGAISAVIDIQTWDSVSHETNSVTLRQGFFEEFSNLEMKLGKRFNSYSGIMFYGGVDLYKGSDQKYSPQYYSTTVNGVPANQDTGVELDDDQMGFRDRLRLKLHLAYDYEDFDMWVRYTQGGKRESGVRRFVNNGPTNIDVGYRQFTTAFNYKLKLADSLRMKLHFSYDMNDRVRIAPIDQGEDENSVINIREDELFFRTICNWSAGLSHEIAFGFEYSLQFFGNDPLGFPHDPYNNTMPNAANSKWQSRSYGVFVEDQWLISDNWTMFTGLRLDKHTYTNFMLSPKVSLVYTPTERDTLKLLFNRSVRRTSEAFLRDEYEVTRKESNDVETLDNVELRYDRDISSNWTAGVAIFYSKLAAISYDGRSFAENVPMGDLSLYGGEVELAYRSDNWNLIFSHGYTQMHEFDMNDLTIDSNVISSSPYGYGEDLQHWSNHITKLYADYKLNEKWRVNTSAVYYWGFPGASDYADYAYNETGNTDWTYGDGSQKAFKSSFYLNAGLEYRPTESLSFKVDAHNILGWFDKDYNKRNYYFNMGTYRQEAAAISMRLEYSF